MRPHFPLSILHFPFASSRSTQAAPPGGDGQAVPPGSDGQAVRPGSDGQAVRPGSDGQAARLGGDGQAAPPGGDGQAVPPGSDGQAVHLGSDGQAAPPCGDGSDGQAVPGQRGLGRGAPATPRATLRAGFSLIEISMVLLLFASAIGGLLSFFPVGLRLETNAISDSAQTMFALDVLGQVEANANAITDWNTWNDTQDFIDAAFRDVKVNNGKTSITRQFKKTTSADPDKDSQTEDIYRTDDDGILIESYLTSRGYMRYVLQVAPVETPLYFGVRSNVERNYRVRRVSVWVSDRRDGDPFMNTPFTLDLIFRPSLDKIMEGGV